MIDTPTAAATLAARVLAGDARAVARAISLIEDGHPAGADLVREIFSRTGRAFIVGVTGPPGAGKSTLVDRLTTTIRRSGQRVGILAIDPTSPFTSGAVLGDRLRMQGHATDAGVFIRSMATRGHLGGLARATGDAALVLDAAGVDVIVIETVGVGQDEVEIVRTADVSVVVLVPGTGDDVQAIKAGIMEIADVFAVNKADRDGAGQLVSAIEANLSLQAFAPGAWRPPVVQTVASSGAGIDALWEAVEQFRARVDAATDGAAPAARSRLDARRRQRLEYQVRELVARAFAARLAAAVGPDEMARVVDRVTSRALDPHSAADELVAKALRGGGAA